MEYPWEDYLLERKVESDLRDLPRTLVAFANSVRPSHVATILIGEKNDGTAAGVTNPDTIQKSVRKGSRLKAFSNGRTFFSQMGLER
jgi:hypothetical protein